MKLNETIITYNKYVNEMKVAEWYRDQLTLKETSEYLVYTYCLNKNESGIFLEIKCPPGRVISICGTLECDNLRFYALSPNLYDIPHYFSIECIGKNNEKLSDDCVIDIIKSKPNNELNFIDSMLYMDISLNKYGKTKEKIDRYYFEENIILYGEESLIFKTTSDIDIINIKLHAKADMFTKNVMK